jgi:GTP-binding protein LepA
MPEWEIPLLRKAIRRNTLCRDTKKPSPWFIAASILLRAKNTKVSEMRLKSFRSTMRHSISNPKPLRLLDLDSVVDSLAFCTWKLSLSDLRENLTLSVITTSPSVIYKVFLNNGKEEMIQNPSNLPDIMEIDHIEEPIVKADIILPKDYVGSIMEICQDRRGRLLHMEYITPTRVQLHYEMPLNEVIYDFFDALKSKTRGYGSLDYEFLRYEKSKLVKLDIMLNKELVDAFSMIVHESKAYAGDALSVKSSKEVIPMHQFEVPIQASIGQKVIARETVRAYRKDVIAKCYGGDISRKKKLLEKQKEGKKRMRQFGKVEVPQEAFTAVLKYDDNK